MDATKLRELLLSFGIFEDNSFLNKYIDLIVSNQHRKPEKFKTQNHHIVPLHVYKYLGIAEDDSPSNLVTLLYTDHVKAHFYLYNCASAINIKRANFASLKFIVHNQHVPESEADLLLAIPGYQQMYDEYCVLNSELQKGVQAGEKNGFYGKKHTEATRKKMSEHHARLSGPNHPCYGKHISEEAKAKISKRNTGRIKTPEEKQRRVDTMNSHGGFGWWITDEYRAKLSMSLKGRNTHSKGRKHINNGVQSKMVTTDELENYLNQGWSLGRLPTSDATKQKLANIRKGIPFTTGYIWVTDGKTSHFIKPEELPKYMDLGYHRGRLSTK